jgi:hypothetical protein
MVPMLSGRNARTGAGHLAGRLASAEDGTSTVPIGCLSRGVSSGRSEAIC